MLDKIEVFDGIKFDYTKSISLKKLGVINYLVGENSSGKSQLLNFILENNQDSIIIQDSFSKADADKFQIKFQNSKLEINKAINSRQIYLPAIPFYNSPNHLNQKKLEKKAEFLIKSIFQDRTPKKGGGYEKLINLILAILISTQEFKKNIILIDGVENGLHPELQKQIPFIFASLSLNFKELQFFISTHSPFLISGVSDVEESFEFWTAEFNKNFIKSYSKEKNLKIRDSKLPEKNFRTSAKLNSLKETTKIKDFDPLEGNPQSSTNFDPLEGVRGVPKLDSHFYPQQKVYFLKNGKVADKLGNISKRGEYGYGSNKIALIAAKMLGVGLIDFAGRMDSHETKNQPVLILCEGEGDGEDASIYNKIFANLQPYVLFVSCKGSSQLEQSFQILKEIKPSLSANFKVRMVRDRDHYFESESQIIEFQNSNPGVKILKRRAIESYILSTEVAQNLLKAHGKKLTSTNKRKLDFAHQKVANETQKGIPGNWYKDYLWNAFLEALGSLNLENILKGRNKKEYLASFIYPESSEYKELFEVLFG